MAQAGSRRAGCMGAFVMALCLGTMPGMAQEVAGDAPATRERQQALFQQLLQRPDDLDLMLEYARVSVALEDYEAAITTLERILMYEPTLGRVEMELGAAYVRLGSDAIAGYHFQQALASGDLTPAERAQVAQFLAAIEQREATSRFSGQVMAGVTASTNASLAPEGGIVQAGGFPVALPPGNMPEGDVGLRVVADLRHDYDLGQPDGDVWRTNVLGYAVQYLEEDQGNINDLLVRTGPTISLGGMAFGPEIRPFAEAEFVRVDDQHLFRGLGGGIEASMPINSQWTAVGSVRAQERQFFDGRSDLDGIYGNGFAGAVWVPHEAVALRGFVVGDLVEADRDFNDYYQAGLRGSGSYLYDPGIDWVSRRWRFDGYLEVARRIFESPNPAVNPTSRRFDTEVRAGISNTAFLVDDFFVRADLDFVDRNSNLPNFELDSLSGTLSVGRVF